MVGVYEPLILPVGALPVFWDINYCPVPFGCDARRVRPCVERFLRKLGHSGPISITAVGKLRRVRKEILEAVSSTGICLYDVPYGRKDIVNFIGIYACCNPSPTNVMLISPPRYFQAFLSSLEIDGHHVILPFPSDSTKSHANALWKNLLLEDPEDVNCSETVEPANWVCGVCGNLPGRGFENFLAHLSSREHSLEIFPWFGIDGTFTFPMSVRAAATNVRTMVREEEEEEDTNFEQSLMRIMLD